MSNLCQCCYESKKLHNYQGRMICEECISLIKKTVDKIKNITILVEEQGNEDLRELEELETFEGRSVYYKATYRNGRFQGWNVYGVTTDDEHEILGHFDESLDALQVVNEIITLMYAGEEFYKVPENIIKEELQTILGGGFNERTAN